MTRQELATASDELAAAAELVENTDHAARLEDLAGQLERLVEADTGPDHGRLARIQSAMHDVREGVGEGAADRIRAAHGAIDDYREELEGV
jgi:hypothetical protein